MDLSFIFNRTLFRISLFISVAVFVVLTTTWIITTIEFRRRLSKTNRDGEKADKEPATMPYAIPWLGSALSFLNNQGQFYDYLHSRIGTAASMCTVRLGPEKSYIALSAAAVEAMFQSTKYISSDRFVRMIIHHGFDMPLEDVNKILKKYPKTPGTGQDSIKGKAMFSQDPLFQKYLISQDAVNVLTTKFIEVFRDALEHDMKIPAKGETATVDLFAWLRGRMFIGTTTSIFGSYILEVYPNLGEDFFTFDAGFLKVVYGTPKFLAGDVYAALRRCLKGTERWLNEALPKLDGQLDPSEGPDWEPYLGCRLMKAKQKLFDAAGLSMKAKASQEVGLLFGVTSNAIPATGWMLFHILSSPQDLLPRVLSELSTAQTADGTLDILKLTTLPFFLSVYAEVLRMYVAVNVTREVHGDFVIDGHLLKKGNTIMAPSWLGHRDPNVWNNLHPDHPPVNEFYAERFLRQEGDKVVCSTAGLSGKYFPYGGGAHICPGRIFAKQEILAAVAMVLLSFECEFVSWVNPFSKDKEERFPRTKKGYVGNGVMAADRDMRVRIRRKIRLH
jgi:Cytochrome P450